MPLLMRIWPEFDPQAEPCSPIVHRSFNRYDGGFINVGLNLSDMALRSLQQKVLRISPDGQKILMNTQHGCLRLLSRPGAEESGMDTVDGQRFAPIGRELRMWA